MAGFLEVVAAEPARLRPLLVRVVDLVADRHAAGAVVGKLAVEVDGDQVTLGGDGAGTPADDWRAVGALLFEALTGAAPPGGEAPSVRGLRPDAPAELALLAAELLDPAPARRPSGAEVRARLRGSGAAATLDVPADLTLAVGATAVDPVADSLPVVRRDAYVMKGELGRGGMGRVLTAFDRRLRRTVALKELLAPADPLAARFEREARITAGLEHPSIVSVHEAGRWPTGEPFYAMKMIAGRSLADLLREPRTMAERLALLPRINAVTEALAYAHSRRVIHRDLKPANILCGSFGETVIVDWGLAKDLGASDGDPDAPSLPPLRADATQSGAVVGTPAYMAPEQARGEPLDERADVFALGAILHQLLTGAPPHHGGTPAQIVARVGREAPQPVTTSAPEVPPDLASIVDRALAFRREDRYASARELADDLGRFLTGRLVAAHRYSLGALVRRWARQHRAALVVAGAALLVLAVGGALSVRSVVRARDRERSQRQSAERAEKEAQRERAVAEQRADDLTVSAAQRALDRDPNQALELLGELSAQSTAWPAARIITADALARGRSQVLSKLPSEVRALAASPGGQLAALDADGTLLVWSDLDGPPRTLSHEARGLAWSGETLAAGVRDRGVVLWSPDGSTREIATEKGAALDQLAFSADGQTLAIHIGAGIVLWWDLVADKRIAMLHQRSMVGGFAMAPDGQGLVSIDLRGAAYFVPKVGAGRELLPPSAELEAVAFAGPLVVAGGKHGLTLIDPARGEPRHELTSIAFNRLAVSPDGHDIYAAAIDGTVHVLNLAGEAPLVWPGHRGAVLAMVTDPGRLVTASMDGTVRIWHVESGETEILRGHADDVGAVTLRGGAVISGGLDHTVRTWQAVRPIELAPLGEPTITLAVSAHGDLAAGGWDGNLRRWAPAARQPVWVSQHGGPKDTITRVAFVGDDLLSASNLGVRLWSAQSQAPRELAPPVDDLLVLADGTVVLGRQRGLSLLDVTAGAERPLGNAPAMYVAPAGDFVVSGGFGDPVTRWRRDGSHVELGRFGQLEGTAELVELQGGGIATASSEGHVQVWRAGAPPRLLGELGQVARGLRLSPDGHTLVAAGGPALLVIDLDSGKTRTLIGHSNPVTAIAFAPSGELASGDFIGELRLWDVASGLSRVLGGHSDQVATLAFTEEGMVSASMDGSVRLWPDRLPRGAALRDWLRLAR